MDTKTCTKCKEELELTAFGKSKYGKNGLMSVCRDCVNLYQRSKYNSDTDRNRIYLNRYGISLDEVNALAEKNNHRCPICNKKCSFFANNRGDAFVVDHDHATNTVRGLICATCNRGLGLFYDDTKFLLSAARYLDPTL